jgi:hypothetical protein
VPGVATSHGDHLWGQVQLDKLNLILFLFLPGLKLLTISMQQWFGVTTWLFVTFEQQVASC